MHLSGFHGNNQALVSNSQIDNAIESLVRSAALNTVRELKSGLSGLEYADNETDFDAMYENNVMDKTLEGLAAGDLEPLTQIQFERELMNEFNSVEMAGLFSSIKKAFKKVVNIPRKILKKTVKVVKKVTKKITPLVKKALPIAAGATALWFTGGAALPFLGSIMGGGGGGGGGIMDTIGAVAGSVFGGSGQQPQPQEIQYIQETVNQAPQNPTMINGGVTALQAILKKRGIAMNSPQAKIFMEQAIRGQYININRKMQPVLRAEQSKQTGIPLNQLQPVQTDKKSILPLLAAGGAALFMFMK